MRRAMMAAAALLMLAAAGSVPAARAAERQIKARDNYFATKFLVITVDDAITWVNEGQVDHTITSYPDVPQGFDSSPEDDPANTGAHCSGTVLQPDDCIEPGGTWRVEFVEPGTYNYYCKAHGNPAVKPDPKAFDAQNQPCGMCAQVLVEKKAGPPPTSKRRPSRPTFTRSPSPSASPTSSPGVSPSPTETFDAAGSPLAAPGSGGGGGDRAFLALLAIAALGGAGYVTWRKFLAT